MENSQSEKKLNSKVHFVLLKHSFSDFYRAFNKSHQIRDAFFVQNQCLNISTLSLHHRVLIWDSVKEPINKKKKEHMLHPPLLLSWVFHSDTENKPPVTSSQNNHSGTATKQEVTYLPMLLLLLFFFFPNQSWMLITILLWLFFPVSPHACHPKKRSCTDFCDNFCLFCLLSISPAPATSSFWRQVPSPQFWFNFFINSSFPEISLPYHLLPSTLALQISFSWISIIPVSPGHKLLCLHLLWSLFFCSLT